MSTETTSTFIKQPPFAKNGVTAVLTLPGVLLWPDNLHTPSTPRGFATSIPKLSVTIAIPTARTGDPLFDKVFDMMAKEGFDPRKFWQEFAEFSVQKNAPPGRPWVSNGKRVTADGLDGPFKPLKATYGFPGATAGEGELAHAADWITFKAASDPAKITDTNPPVLSCIRLDKATNKTIKYTTKEAIQAQFPAGCIVLVTAALRCTSSYTTVYALPNAVQYLAAPSKNTALTLGATAVASDLGDQFEVDDDGVEDLGVGDPPVG